MPVAKICLTAMILRNAHVTMNSCQTGRYFILLAPSFEDWISAGPRERNANVNNNDLI